MACKRLFTTAISQCWSLGWAPCWVNSTSQGLILGGDWGKGFYFWVLRLFSISWMESWLWQVVGGSGCCLLLAAKGVFLIFWVAGICVAWRVYNWQALETVECKLVQHGKALSTLQFQLAANHLNQFCGCMLWKQHSVLSCPCFGRHLWFSQTPFGCLT